MKTLQTGLSLVVFGTALLLIVLGACQSVPVTAPMGAVVSIFASPGAIPFNGTTTLTISVFELSGQPVPNDTEVTLVTTLGTLATSLVKTTGGFAQTTLQATTQAGTATVTASSGSATPGTVRVTMGTTVMNLTLDASPATLGVGGGRTTITATTRDDTGAPLPNISVIFSTDQGSLASAGRSLTSGSGGTVSDQLTTTRDAVVTVTVGGGTTTATVMIDVRGSGANSITVTASPASLPPGLGTSTISATVLSDAGEPVPGLSVAFSTTAGSLTQLGAVSTNASGIATNTLHSDRSATVTATAPGASGMVTVSIGAPTPTNLSVDLSVLPTAIQSPSPTPTPGVACTGADTVTLTLSVTATSGTTAVGGLPVVFFVEPAAARARVRGRFLEVPPRATTNALGQATARYMLTDCDLEFCREIPTPCSGANCVSATPIPACVPAPPPINATNINDCCCGMRFTAQVGDESDSFVFRVFTTGECPTKNCGCLF